jgi:hypothetical protein
VAVLKQAQQFADWVRPFLQRYPELTYQEVEKLHADAEPFHNDLKQKRAELRAHLARTGHVLE